MSRDVTIHGTGFKGIGFEAGPLAIHAGPTNGPTNVTNVVVVSDSKITCTLPPHDPTWPKRVGIWITTPMGVGHRDNIYHYSPPTPLTILGISPGRGNYAGGVALTITGSGFAAVAGEHPAIDQAVFYYWAEPSYLTDIVVVDDNTITAVSPAGWPGRSYALQLSDGVRSVTKSDLYVAEMLTYVAGLSPNHGTWSGGQACTLVRDSSGALFTTIARAAITQVGVVDPYALAYDIVDGDSLTFTMPNANTAGFSPNKAGGIVTITFYNATGGIVARVTFSYEGLSLDVISPVPVPIVGGTPMVLTGKAFDTVTAIYIDDEAGLVGPTTVDPATWHLIDENEIDIDSIPDAPTVCSTVFARYRLVGVSEAGLGAVESSNMSFMFVDSYTPYVLSCTPSHGDPGVDTDVTIKGWNFQPPSHGVTEVKRIYDGGGPTLTFAVVDDNTITATMPSGGLSADSPYGVKVTSGWGAGLGANLFSYDGVPEIMSQFPTDGPAAGGTLLQITIRGSTSGCTGATVGGVALTSFSIVDEHTVQGVTGAHAAGAVDSVVTNGYGDSAPAAGFTYT